MWLVTLLVAASPGSGVELGCARRASGQQIDPLVMRPGVIAILEALRLGDRGVRPEEAFRIRGRGLPAPTRPEWFNVPPHFAVSSLLANNDPLAQLFELGGDHLEWRGEVAAGVRATAAGYVAENMRLEVRT